jgi:hypothetical protein
MKYIVMYSKHNNYPIVIISKGKEKREFSYGFTCSEEMHLVNRKENFSLARYQLRK